MERGAEVHRAGHSSPHQLFGSNEHHFGQTDGALEKAVVAGVITISDQVEMHVQVDQPGHYGFATGVDDVGSCRNFDRTSVICGNDAPAVHATTASWIGSASYPSSSMPPTSAIGRSVRAPGANSEKGVGELYVVGGAVMCLVQDAREATRDVDALFKPTKLIREAAARVATRANVPSTWLNDAVKGFLSPRGTFVPYLERPHLRVYVAEPHYLLAMKCAAMRLGEEFHDLDDVRYLLRHLDISTVDEAVAIVRRYFDEDQLQSKTRLALEELFST